MLDVLAHQVKRSEPTWRITTSPSLPLPWAFGWGLWGHGASPRLPGLPFGVDRLWLRSSAPPYLYTRFRCSNFKRIISSWQTAYTNRNGFTYSVRSPRVYLSGFPIAGSLMIFLICFSSLSRSTLPRCFTALMNALDGLIVTIHVAS